ncbi:Condensin-2 complex subunit D3, partial [Geodia barretti]
HDLFLPSSLCSHLVAECGERVLVPLKGLVQQLCTKTPDRAEYRTKMANTVCKLLSQFPDQFYSQLLEWLSRLARNIKVSAIVCLQWRWCRNCSHAPSGNPRKVLCWGRRSTD